jgi:2-octaprenylphenol hydroxylase
MNARAEGRDAAYDVVIVGGGIIGAALAAALGGSALKVAVIEPQAPPAPPADGFDLRVSALTLASQTVLERVGAWPGIVARRVAEVRAMRVWQARGVPAAAYDAGGGAAARRSDGGFGEIRFEAAEIGEPCLAYIAENSVIGAALYEGIGRHANIHWIAGAFGALEAGGRPTVTLADGRRLGARLVVGADGADSAVRRSLAVPVRRLDMRQLGIVATVHTERPHEDTAWQVFLPTGPLAFLPLSEARACAIVWSADRARAEELLALDDAGFRAALAQAFGERLGRIETVSARAAFPLRLAHADRYVAEGAALIGDAAHVVHPLAGQGANLGLLDAAALAEVVLDAAAGRRDIGAAWVLRRYERWRKGENIGMIAVTGGFKYLFGNDWPVVSQLRAAGLSLTDRLGPAKNLIMRRAAGLTGDLPRLARRQQASGPSP